MDDRFHAALAHLALHPAVNVPGASQPENDGAPDQGVAGWARPKLRTAQDRSLFARAMGEVLNGKPWSRRHLARVLGVDERIVRGWCSADRPINDERLLRDAPIVFVRWVERIERLIAAEERAA